MTGCRQRGQTYWGITRAGLSASTSLTHSFTVLCGNWSLLNVRKPGPNLVEEFTEACRTQKALDTTDHWYDHTPTRYVLRVRVLKKFTKSNIIHVLTVVTVPGFFQTPPEDPLRSGEEKTLTRQSSISGTTWTLQTRTIPSKIFKQSSQGSSGRSVTMNGALNFTRRASPKSPSNKERSSNSKVSEPNDGGAQEN